MSKIKILVTYKERHQLISSDIITPIQSGRAIAAETFEEMIGDDTGDNISEKNPLYSELSAIYWAWKNYDQIGSPDYIGFMHYRRQFLFDSSKLDLGKYQRYYSSFYKILHLDDGLKECFTDDKILGSVPGYDYIIPEWHYAPHKNIRAEYILEIPGSKAEIFDKFIEICRNRLPDYKEEIDAIEFGNKVQVCNMFVMKKELFFELCKFMFPILEALEQEVDSTDLTPNGKRFVGYMAEKLISMFIMRLQKEGGHKYKYLNCSYVINPDNLPIKFAGIRKTYYKILYYFLWQKHLLGKLLIYKDICAFFRYQKYLEGFQF